MATSALTFLVGVLIGVTILAAAIQSRQGDAPPSVAADDDTSDESTPSSNERTRPAADSVAPPPAPPPEKTPAEKLLAADELADALVITKPLMRDTHNELDKGMLALAMWSLDHLTWKDVAVAQDETSVKSTMKDPDAARGKRMCIRGTLVQIELFKVAGGKKGFEGIMVNHRRELIRFIATKSTGDLVQNSPARLCGVVTGKYTYENSAGGTGHAVAMVGIFDLPENKP